MWYLLAFALPAAAEETYLGRFMAGTSSSFSGSSQYNHIFLALGMLLVILLLNVVIYYWAKEDFFVRHGKKIPAYECWFFLVLGPVTALVYLATRPQGAKVICLHCEKPKLQDAPACPYCGYEITRRHHARPAQTTCSVSRKQTPAPPLHPQPVRPAVSAPGAYRHYTIR